jgi:hypothetical protein
MTVFKTKHFNDLDQTKVLAATAMAHHLGGELMGKLQEFINNKDSEFSHTQRVAIALRAVNYAALAYAQAVMLGGEEVVAEKMDKE